MDSQERFNETSLPPKKDFYSELILKYISDKDYAHAQKVFNEYCTSMSDYHDLYVQTDTFLLVMFLKNLETNALKYMDLFLFCTWISMASMFKKDRCKIVIVI